MMNLFYFPEFKLVPGAEVISLKSGKMATNYTDFSALHRSDDSLGENEFSTINWPLPLDKEIFRKDDWFDSIT